MPVHVFGHVKFPGQYFFKQLTSGVVQNFGTGMSGDGQKTPLGHSVLSSDLRPKLQYSPVLQAISVRGITSNGVVFIPGGAGSPGRYGVQQTFPSSQMLGIIKPEAKHEVDFVGSIRHGNGVFMPMLGHVEPIGHFCFVPCGQKYPGSHATLSYPYLE